MKGERDMPQVLLFETLDEIQAYAETFQSNIRFEFESSDTIVVRMYDEVVSRLKYQSVTWNHGEPETYIVKGEDLEKFDFLFEHIDFLKQLVASNDVKEINVRTVGVTFVYKEERVTCIFSKDSDSVILRMESEDKGLRFMRLNHFSEVFETLDRYAKKF